MATTATATATATATMDNISYAAFRANADRVAVNPEAASVADLLRASVYGDKKHSTRSQNSNQDSSDANSEALKIISRHRQREGRLVILSIILVLAFLVMRLTKWR